MNEIDLVEDAGTDAVCLLVVKDIIVSYTDNSVKDSLNRLSNLLVTVAGKGYLRTTEYILGAGVSADSNSNAAIVEACSNGEREAVQLLSANGADLRAGNYHAERAAGAGGPEN